MFKKSLLIMLLMAMFAPWAAMGQETLTIYENETGTNTYVPFCVNYNDGYQATEFIIPASELTAIVNAEITALQFYVDVATYSLNGTISIYLQETTQDEITYSNYKRYFFGPEGATKVYEGSLSIADNKLSIPFTTNYTYEGDNLVVCLHQSAKGTGYQSQNFYGKANTSKAGAIYKYSTSTFTYNSELTGSAAYFTPKTTITYETTGGACPKPKTLAFSDIATQSATFSWVAGTGYTGTYDVAISQTEATEPQASEIVATDHNINTYGFTGLTPQTTYWAYVRAHCGSDWVKKDFTTEAMCDAPTGLSATNLMSNTADLSWTAGGEETSWNLRYKKTTDAEWTTINNVTLTNGVYTLEGLASISTYIFQVQANCPGTENFTSNWSASSDEFTTDCGAIEIGYANNFDTETTGAMPQCWKKINQNTYTYSQYYDNYPQVSSSNGYQNSANKLYFYASSYITTEIAVLPEADVANLSGTMLTFYARTSSSTTAGKNKTLKISVLSDPTDVTTWDEDNEQTITVLDNTYRQYTAYLPNTTDKYIGIKYVECNNSNNYYVYVDNVTFEQAPTCFQPQNLTASSLTSNSVSLTWEKHTQGTETSWVLQYATNSTFTEGLQTVNVSDNPTTTISNLNEYTVYYARVKPACDDEGNLWSTTVTFTTKKIVAIPYSYNFETATDMNYWEIRNSYVANNSVYSGRTSGNGYNSSSYSFRFYYYSADYTPQYLVSPELSNINAGVHVEFYSKMASNSNTINVGYSTTSSDTFIWNEVPTTLTTTYQLIECNFPANTKYIAIKYDGNAHVYIDDISLTEHNDCVKPTGLTAVENTLSSDDITLTWTAGGEESEWTLQYATNATFTEGVVTIEDINTNSKELTGLLSNTQYFARVKANCSETSESDWCNDVYNFTTYCGTYAIPHSYGFEEAAEMDCWTILNASTNTKRATGEGANNGTYFFQIYYKTSGVQYLISPELSNTNNGVHVEFYYRRYNNNANSFKVGYSTVANATDDTDFTWTPSITNSTLTYQKFEEDFIANDIKHIAIKYETTTYSYLYVDDFTFDELPSCFKPKDLAVDNSTLTAHTATLSWTPGYDETAWTLQYSTNADFSGTPEEVAVETNPTTEITDLAGSTVYYVRVKADCGENNSSVWSATISFETPVACTTPTDFAAISSGSHHASLYWTADEGQDTWDVEYSTSSTYTQSTLIEGITGNHSAENPYLLTGLPTAGTMYYVRVRSNCGGSDGVSAWSGNKYISTPGVTAPSNFTASDITTSSANITWTGAAANDYHVDYEVCFSTTNSVPADLIEDENYFIGITETTFSLDNLEQNTTYYVWVRDNCGTDGYSSWASTNFTTLELCPTPTNLHVVSYTSTTATLEWTAATGQSAWMIYYSTSNQAPAPDQATDIVAVNTNPYTLTNLTAETTYYAWVRGDCGGEEGQSNWSQVCEFMPSAAVVLDLYTDGTTTNDRIPFYADNASSNAGMESQFIIPATDMGNAIKGGTIQKLTFYSNYGYDASFGAATFDVKISEVDNSYFTSTSLIAISSEAVYSGSFSYSNGKLTITLTEPYLYQGGNLIVDIKLTKKGSDTYISWIGKATTEYQSLYKPYSGSNTRYQFVPKTTITYLPAVAFTTAGNWNEAGNWSTGEIPGTTDNVLINAAATIPSNYIAEVNNIFIGTGSLTIADGGQLKHNNEGVVATVKKNFTGYTNYTGEGNGGYYLIASPVTENLISQQLTAMGLTPYGNVTGAHYDLYAWDGSQTNEEWQNWENTQNENHHFPLAHYNGYLYANQDDVEVSFTGTLESSENEIGCEVNYNGGGFASLSLWGNPFVCNVYLSSNMEAMAFYRMNDDGDGFIAATGAIKPMEGFFVQAVDKENQMFYINRTQPNSSKNININLSQGESLRDCAIVRFGEGNTLEKFSLSNNTAKLYIPQGTKDYAVVRSNGQGEMPVNFKAETNGTYTISVEPENVDVTYLHLIDNRTGANVDLLANPSYTFNANKGDNANRFRLVFKANTDVEDNTASETFAYFNGSEWVISNMGDATLQVIDMMGRVLRSEQINGNTAVNINETAGIYMLRLVNGENVMVQKVVVK